MKKLASLLLVMLLIAGIGVSASAANAMEIIGEIDGKTYRNDFFELYAEFPNDWRILSDKELAENVGYPASYGSREGLAKMLQEQSATYGLFAAAEDGTYSNLNFVIEDMGVSNKYLSEQTYYTLVKDGLKEALQQQGYQDLKITDKSIEFPNGEHVCVVVEGKLQNIKLVMYMILIKQGQYMGAISVGSGSKAQVDEIVDFFRVSDPQSAGGSSNSEKSDSSAKDSASDSNNNSNKKSGSDSASEKVKPKTDKKNDKGSGSSSVVISGLKSGLMWAAVAAVTGGIVSFLKSSKKKKTAAPTPAVPYEDFEKTIYPEKLSNNRMASLRLHVIQTGEDLLLSGKTSFELGRTPERDICITDGKVSRQHCVIRFSNGEWSLEDLGSSNGTTLNDSPLVPHRPYPLRIGDRIRLADSVDIQITG